MKFRYQAKTREGENQVGYVEAANRDSAVNILSSHGLFILKLEEAEKKHWYDSLSGYFSRVKRQDMVVFTRQLAILLEAQLSLNHALQTLQEQTKNPTLKEAIFEIAQDVDSGLSFSQALERQNKIFSEFFVSMVRSAEITGNLEKVAGFLADYTEREAVLVTKARSAMIYPSIVVGLFVTVAVIMITVVFPQIAPIFEQSGVELPLLTKLFINSGIFFSRFWFLILIVLGVLIGMLFDYLRTPEGRAFADDFKIRFPLVHKIYLPVTISRFANAAAMLSQGGVPVAQAMEIAGETVDNILYRDILHEISSDVRQGIPLSEAIAKYPDYFPALVPQMLAVGEATGQMNEILMRIANFYSRETDSVVNNLVDLIQPVLMIGIGVLVGVLFAAILLPLYRLTSVLQ